MVAVVASQVKWYNKFHNMNKMREGKLMIFSFFIAIFVSGMFFLPAQAEVSVSSSAAVAASTTEIVAEETTSSSPWGERENYITEPKIRVGVAKMDKKIQFVSPFVYNVYAGENFVGAISANQSVSLFYEDGRYSLTGGGLDISGGDYFRLIPEDLANYFSILNLDRHLIGRSQMNFATFRGALEYRYAPKSKMPYLINELYLENYVSGIAETSNGAPDEYIKALQIAARTYAYTNIGPPPSEERMFDVYANTNDQLYLGYNFEEFSPRIAFFTAGTRGMMVTYKDKPVVTYYFSRSSGRTKTKKGIPWLKSVVCKYDKGWRQLGHGYGMSNRDAAARAKKDKWNYDKILTYYYSGTEIKKIYD